jgi:16S rRNA C1402 N4-methylase RsmH
VLANTLKPKNFFPNQEVLFDSILLDLGYSTYQLNDKRGLSYLKDEDFLDMRFDNSENPANPATAADILNTSSPYELVDIF